jgi:tRNA threonylcarbamoyladenosine biosynthesis protein TsaE
VIAVRTFPSRSPEETLLLGRRLGELLEAGHVVGLSGELGAGKTCFASGAASGLGVPEGIYVSSPTFTLVNEYPGRVPVAHVDLYRLATSDDLLEIGYDEYCRGGFVCLVEWFDRFPDEAPPGHLEIRFLVTSASERRLEARAVGPLHSDLLCRWDRACTAQGSGGT